ncbi:MAG: glycine cleavage system protein GcvH [Desulfovibrionaceae bacterium]|nr:glycine cleavage system protein GcvH [Desulfovibrionaceae bacterium]
MSKNISELVFPDDLRYSDEHVWVRLDGEEALAGISDYAQDQLGEVAFVELPETGAEFAAGEEFGTIESLKSVSNLYMPVSGEIIAVNDALEANPTLVNASCYETGWIVRIRVSNAAEADKLLSADQYRNFAEQI